MLGMKLSPDKLAIWQVLLGGGLLSAIITGLVALRKHPLDRKTAKLEHSKTTVGIAIETLKAVNDQYNVMQEKHAELEKKLDVMQKELNTHSTLLGQFKKYIVFLHDNWEELRKHKDPPPLTEQIKHTIFKEY